MLLVEVRCRAMMPAKHSSHRHVPSWSRRPQAKQRPTKNFDSESGLVFTETSVPVRSRQHSDWIGELKTPSLIRKRPSNAEGARSLFATARNQTAREFRALTTEHFASIPWVIAQGIWQEIIDSRAESLHIWRTLAVSYGHASEFVGPEYRYHLDIRQPSLALESYLSGITSTSISWLTALRISPKETRIADLVSMAKVTNLAVLDLSDGQVSIATKPSSFDERIMRTWSELTTAGSFRHLSVLLLGWQENVDQWIFRYLPSFPNLQCLIMTDCPRIHQKNRKDWEVVALDQGWEARHAKRSAKSLRPYLREPKFPLGAVSGLYYTTSQPTAHRPMLECSIGTPKTWTHILDDFPGTRTVLFDRVKKVVPSQGEVLSRGPMTKRSRERTVASSSAPNSPEPKRSMKPKLRTKTGGSGELEELLSGY